MNLRFMYGLHWKRKHPPIPARQLLLVALCLATYGAVARVDSLAERAQEMEALAESNAGLAEVTLSCMNGAAGYYFKQANLAYSCGEKL